MKRNMQAYWKTNIAYMVVLLSIWGLVSLVFGIVLVNELNAIKIGGFPLGFWFAQQGAIYVFALLILVYFLLMRRLDRRYDIDE